MVFSSPIFLLLFLPVVLGLYQFTPGPLKNLVLLLSSLVFYGWAEPVFVVLMLTSIVLNYLFGLWLSGARRDRHNVLALAVVANLGLLVYFKYANFLAGNLSGLLNRLGLPTIELPDIALPIGISFFTFQAMSYIFDVYRGDAEVQKNPINVALYIALFPQLIAGPIVRYGSVAAQLVQRSVDLDGFAYGVRRFIIGLGKKVLIANSVAVVADEIFAQPTSSMPLGVAWLGIICYTLQIYFDFSGYSDMAIGLGRMFGFRFPENFNYPYVSASITEFWRRWHISLSSWFRDYLYIPLGGNRGRPWRVYVNLLTVFTLCGLWHGAQWTFLVWGLYHGAFLILERIAPAGPLAGVPKPFKHVYALLVVMVGWVFFRAASFAEALVYLQAAAGLNGAGVGWGQVVTHVDSVVALALVAGCLGSLPLVPMMKSFDQRLSDRPAGSGQPGLLDSIRAFGGVLVLLLIFAASVMSVSAETYNPFIYFRF